MTDLSPLMKTFPPKHAEPHRPKAKPKNTNFATVIDRLPSQGTVDWKKQERIGPVADTDHGIWGIPPQRGLNIRRPVNAKKRKKS